jgi:hypothetical protein
VICVFFAGLALRNRFKLIWSAVIRQVSGDFVWRSHGAATLRIFQ